MFLQKLSQHLSETFPGITIMTSNSHDWGPHDIDGPTWLHSILIKANSIFYPDAPTAIRVERAVIKFIIAENQDATKILYYGYKGEITVQIYEHQLEIEESIAGRSLWKKISKS